MTLPEYLGEGHLVLLWLGLAGFFGFIAFRSFTTGSYLRGGFASFAVLLFAGAIWISFQAPSAEAAPERASAQKAPGDPFSDR